MVVFSRDGGTGALTFVEAVFDGAGGVDGLDGANSVTVSPDGAHVYITGNGDDAVAVFERDAGTGTLTFVEAEFNGENGVVGLEDAFGVTVSPDGAHVYMTSVVDDLVVVFDRDGTTGELTFVDNQFGADLRLAGRRLLITNAVPENKERNKGKWLVKDVGIVAPRADFVNDPRCFPHGPLGSGGATIRFFSSDSAHDTGSINLPCTLWGTIRPSDPRGYRYKDPALSGGPCRKVLLVGGRRLKVDCFGKGATTDFLYDLVEGTGEGVVNVVLTMGGIKYCGAFDAFDGRDGSDGKKFRGRDAPPPLSCPQMPSPSAAFLDPRGGLLD